MTVKSLIKKINMRFISGFMLFLACVAIFFSIRELGAIYQGTTNQLQVEQERRMCEEESQNLASASDYLTMQVWRFIATKQVDCMTNYWQEIDVKKNRDKSLERLQSLNLTQEELALVKSAKEESDKLIFKEAWAMRLTAESIGLSKDEVPSRVAGTKLSQWEEQLSSGQKSKLALDYIFGNEYMDSKLRISNDLSDFRQLLRKRKSTELEYAVETTQKALVLSQFFSLAILLLLVLCIIAFYLLITRPLNQYSNALKNLPVSGQKVLTPAGDADMRRFANIFNKIYTEWHSQNQRLKELNSIDILTQLPNRTTFEKYMLEQIEHGTGQLGVFMIDIDSFKSFNDSYGHMAGDQALIQIGRCLAQAVPEGKGMAGRISGEEFVIALSDTTAGEVQDLADRLLCDIRRLNLDHDILPLTDTDISVSIGSVIWCRKDKATPLSLVHKADLALYRAKSKGKNQHIMFSENDYSFIVLQSNHARDLEVELKMREALKKGEFIPYFQPQYDLKTGNVCGAEALIRWLHPKRGLLAPDYFIPVFERSGFIVESDLYMFETICRFLHSRIEEGLCGLPIACNFSRIHFKSTSFADTLKEITDRYRIPPSMLEIEITESALMDNPENISVQAKQLRDMGFSIAIDDFGVGYSSLGILQDLPADTLKIDKGFLVHDMQDRKNVMVLQGIVTLAKAFHLRTVCEGVETQQQQALLQKIGCDIGQGFFYAKPMPQKDLESLLDAASDTGAPVT